MGLLNRRLPMTVKDFENRVQPFGREIAGDLPSPRLVGRIGLRCDDLPSRKRGPQAIGCNVKCDRLAIDPGGCQTPL